MYLTGCFIVFLIVLLVIYIKGNLTIRDILISLLCIALSWITLIICFLGILFVIGTFISVYWTIPIWKAKQKSKLYKKLETLLD